MISENAYARVTLALDINPRLESGPWKGYHPTQALKCEIDLHDELTIEESDCRKIICDDPDVPTDRSNTVSKAVDVMKEKYGIKKEVKITIKKSIPLEGGLAGGSSDAAAVMRMLVRLWKIDCTTEDLIALGKNVGMDVPFFFVGGICMDQEVTGIPVPVPCARPIELTLFFPKDKVSTQSAYDSIDHSNIGKDKGKTLMVARAIEKGYPDLLRRSIHNDFEKPVLLQHENLKKTLHILREAGIPSVISGSGSTVVGFGDDPSIPSLKTQTR